MRPGRRFDLYADDRSQVYGRVGAETARTLEATDRTAGRVLTFEGHVALTYFFSTSGGRTADVRDVWPALGAIPYLRSVADPYGGGSPVHAWGRGWRIVAHARVDARGVFRTPVRLHAGGYRVTVDADGRYAATERRVRVTTRLPASPAH